MEQISQLTPLQKWHLDFITQHKEYEERPVDIRTFIDSPEYIDAKDECWEAIKEDLECLFEGYDDASMTWKYNEAVFDEGIGAGKSYKASLIITYLLYRTLILKDPHKFLGLARGSGIYFMNMSVRADQAKKIVFGEIYQRIINSPWFRDRNYLPDDSIRSELRFPKNIYVVPGNSKETFPLGFNLLGAVMDEAAYYVDIESHDVAEEIYNALYNRIRKRFGTKGMLAMISSPRYIEDFIERKMEEAKTNLRIFSRRRATFDAQPSNKYSGEKFEIDNLIIPIEDKEIYIRNPERYKRDIMALPSLTLEPYFKMWELVKQCIDATMFNPVVGNQFVDAFRGNSMYTYHIHIDLSLTQDSTGIGMCHKENENVIVDLALKVKPPNGGEIDLAAIRAIVLELRARNFNIVKCTFDQFQSASSIQELNKSGIMAEKLSVDKDLAPYETLKELLYSHRLRTYYNDDLLDELKRLELTNGKRVDHPSKGSKDVADAVAGCVYNCITNQNNFSFGFAGGRFPVRNNEQALKEAQTLSADGLVPYGYYRGRRQ